APDADRRNFAPNYVGADSDGPVIAVEDGQLVVRVRRWGFPAWADKGKPITNIRNLESTWWRGANGEYISKPEYRCLVPFDRFAEWDSTMKANAWFTVDAEFPCFAGFWRPWHGERLKAVEGKKRRQREVDGWELFAFMTTEPNKTVAAVHPKAMPAIITTAADAKRWLTAEPGSLDLQRLLPDDMMVRQSRAAE
ncbi:MAG: SOS response-associated peptidase family protein, partial [Pacificimonas sp.]